MQFLQEVLPAVGQQYGDFELLEELGRGGFGIVFRARHRQLGEEAALKFMIPSLLGPGLTNLARRFGREVSALKRLQHPHIVRVLDVGVTEHSLPYYAMEMLVGHTLRAHILAGVMPASRVAHIATQILSALETAHRASVVHRDLKPQNIIVRRDHSFSDYITVIDFGIAKVLNADETLTGTGELFGSPRYMAPETFEADEQVDHRVDLYALGLIMAECLTGKPVVGGSLPLEIGYAHVRPTPHTFDPRVQSSSLFPIIRRATQKQAAERYPDAESMLAAIAALSLPDMTKEEPRQLPPPPIAQAGARQDQSGLELFFDAVGDATIRDPGPSSAAFLEQDVDASATTHPPVSESLAPQRSRGRRLGAVIITLPLWALVGYLVFSLLGPGQPSDNELSHLANEEPSTMSSTDAGGSELDLVSNLGETTVAPDGGSDTTVQSSNEVDPPRHYDLRHRRLTAEPADVLVSLAAISPDGRRLAYATNAGLQVRDVETSEVFSIPTGPGRQAYSMGWYPDSSAIVSVERTPTGAMETWSTGIPGGDRTYLFSDGMAAAVSPSGEQVAYVNEGGLWLRRADGGAPERFASLGATQPYYYAPLTWSPTGGAIALLTYEASGGCASTTLHVFLVPSGERRALLSGAHLCNEGAIGGLAWLPDGRIVFARENIPSRSLTGGSNLWFLPVDPTTGDALSDPTQLTHTEGFRYFVPNNTSDGDAVAYVRSESAYRTYLAELSHNGRSHQGFRDLTSDERSHVATAWTQNGELLLVSDRAGLADIFRANPETGAVRNVRRSGTWDWYPTVSGDGLWTLFWVSEQSDLGGFSRSALWRLPATDGPLDVSDAELVAGPYEGQSPPAGLALRCPRTPDAACVLRRVDESRIVFEWLDPVSGPGAEVLALDASSTTSLTWDLSADASEIVVAQGDSVWRVNTSDGVRTPMFQHSGLNALSIVWSHDAQGFFLLQAPPASLPRLSYVDFTGRFYAMPVRLSNWFSNPLPSPDGRYLSLVSRERDSDVWLLEGLDPAAGDRD